MGKLLPVIIAIVGLGVGAGAGLVLKPDAADTPTPEEKAKPAHGADAAHGKADAHGGGHGEEGEDGADYVKLNNQFVIPVVHDGRVASLVVLSLSLEVTSGGNEPVYEREPKLRDAFLQVMFDHANAGGFDGAFTQSGKMTLLRRALLEVAQQVLGPKVNDVLIIDIVRQDA
ncbi:MAG: flagellar basal body-associated FliL family protein [Rhodobacteraceae bacterium]|nr:flagellar basal body-associated FliL family protein [Paracoccaceae bacterium]